MQKLNTNYILLSMVLIFASPKKVYAQEETNLEIGTSLQSEQQYDSNNLERQQEILKELFSNLEIEVQQIESDSSSNQQQAEITHAIQNLTSEQQEQIINTVVTNLTPTEQQVFIELLEEAAHDTQSTPEKPKDQAFLEKLLEKIDSSRCLNFCIKLTLAILFWEVVQKSDFVENNKMFPKSAQELFKAFTTVLFVDDIKDFVKEIKRIVEGECEYLYKKLY